MPEDEDHVDLGDLAIFLTVLGEGILRAISDLEAMAEDPRGRLWIQKAEALGLVMRNSGGIRFHCGALRTLRDKLRRMFSKWLQELRQPS